MQRKNLQAICFGAINLDLIYEVDEKVASILGIEPGYEYFKKEDELNEILGLLEKEGTFRCKSGGGSAANTALALARLGIKTGLIGKVGRDREGDFLLESLEGVDKRGIKRAGRSGIALCLLIKGERSIIIFPNANDSINTEDINEDYAESCDLIHLTSFSGDSPFNAQKTLIAGINPAINISFDPGILYAKRGSSELLPILKKTKIFFPEKKELEILTGKAWKEGAREVIAMGVKVVACSMAEKGSHIFTSDEDFHVDAQRVDVIDTTGAGDVYAAGFIAFYLRGKTLKECAVYATTIASRSVTGFGRERYPGRS